MMLHTDMDFCHGKGCALREHCKRYLAGREFSADEYPQYWIDSCDEDTRPLYIDKQQQTLE